MPAFVDRRAFIAGAAALTSLPAITPVHAQNDVITVRPGAFRPIRIAVGNFTGDPDAARLFTSVVSNNFKRSVFLQPVDPASFPEQLNPDQPPNMEAWKAVNAQYVLIGRVQRGGDGRQRAEFRLWDVASGQQAAGQQYATDPNVSRRVAHIMSDQVFSRITGEKGFFDTRVVFVDETGPADKRRKFAHGRQLKIRHGVFCRVAHEDRFPAPGPLARDDIPLLVANHPGMRQVQAVLLRGVEQHAWVRFAV